MLSQAIQQVLFTRPLEKEVPDIVKKYGGSLYVPSPANCFQDSAGTTPCTVDSPVGYLKDLIGTNHATQGTAGYKPILRGKVKNLLLNSATLSTQNITSVAAPYTLHFTGTGTVTLSGTSTAGPLVGTGANDRVSLTFTPTAGTLTLTVSGSVTTAQLELGSKVNPYVPTTSAAASSSYGPYWLDFDGTDDRLQLGSVPFQLQDDPFAVVGAFIRYSTTVNGRIIDTGSTSARIQILSNNTTGYLGVGFTDDTTASQFLTEAVNSTNTYNVHTLYKLKDVKLNRRNSQQKVINTTALSVSTCTASYIGCAYSPAAFTGMQLYSIALGKGAPLTDISKIEKYAAKLSGAQL